MFLRLFLVLFFLFTSLFAKEVSIATYNVENLFDAKIEGSEYKDYKLGNHGWNKKMAKIKFSNTREALSLINADIIGLQEIENENLLKNLAKNLGYAYVSFSKPKGSPVGVGVLSRYPITFQKSYHSGVKFSRDFLHVKVKLENRLLNLWVVHFPSLKQPKHKRQKVANSLKRLIKTDKDTIILGDFNTPLKSSSILQKSFGTLHVKKNEWYEPWFEHSFKTRWSHSFFREKKALDRILLSLDFFDNFGLEYVKGSFKRVDKSFLKDKYGNPKRWKRAKKGKGKHLGIGYSDHFPLILKISTKSIVQNPETVQLESIFVRKNQKVHIELKKMLVTYKNKDGFVLSQNSRGIYVYKPDFDLELGSIVDVEVHEVKDYHGMKEIVALHVKKIYADTLNPTSGMLLASQLKKARAGDVLKEITGKVKNGYLHSPQGKIKLYAKNPKLLPRHGMHVTLKRVRVGLFKGEKELILENRN